MAPGSMTIFSGRQVDTDGTIREVQIPGGLKAGSATPNNTMGADLLIAVPYSIYVPDYFEVSTGRSAEVAAGATMEVG